MPCRLETSRLPRFPHFTASSPYMPNTRSFSRLSLMPQIYTVVSYATLTVSSPIPSTPLDPSPCTPCKSEPSHLLRVFPTFPPPPHIRTRQRFIPRPRPPTPPFQIAPHCDAHPGDPHHRRDNPVRDLDACGPHREA